jgi:hemolysin activation/secretion protein
MTRRVLLRLSPLLLATGALAQPVVIPPGADPGVIQQREMEREQRRRLDEERRQRIEQPVAPAAPPAAAGPSAADSLQFQVNEIRFEPASEILSAAELDALAAPYRGRTLRLADLRELVAKINELYRARGVVTAQAALPPQDVTGGVVRIRLVEGRVGQYRIQGNASTREDFITERITLQPQQLVDLPRLEHDLLRFNRSNDAQLRADLVPGQAFGQTDIALAVTEPKRDDLRLFADTAGSSATGETRTGIAWMRRSLTGHRDDLYLSAVRSAGHEGYYATYNVPITTRGTRATFGFFKDRTHIVNGPIEALDVTGAAETYSLQLRHPLVVGTRFQLDALGSLKKRRTSNWIVGTPLTSSTLNSASLGLDAQVLDERGYWTASAEYFNGVDRVTFVEPRQYRLMRASVRRSHTLSPQLLFNASLNMQFASVRQLPASEQIVIGGEGTVRGFSSGLFSGDRGHVLNLELHRKLEMPAQSPVAASVFGFWDMGNVQPFRPPSNTRDSDELQSIGAGLNFAYGSRATARITVGVPLRRPVEEPRDYRVHAQVVWFFL